MFFFFVLWIITIIFVIVIAIHTSRIGIDVENLIIDTEKTNGQKINKESKIYVYLLIFGKVKLFKKDVKKMKQPNLKLENKNIDITILKNRELKINYIELLKNINIDIKKINLYAQIGTQDAAITAILVGLLSSILGIVLKKPKYQIYPIYSNKNLLKVKIECIISIYLMQYIYKLIQGKLRDKFWTRFQIYN